MKQKSANRINYTRVLREIWLNEGVSRIEISENLALDKSTITNITAALQDAGIIHEFSEGEAGPQGGRKPKRLKISKDLCAVAGIEVQPEYCCIVAVNLAGEILFSMKITADIDAYSFSGVFTRIEASLKEELRKQNIRLAGIGLGLSGVVNHDSGTIMESIPLGVRDEYAIVEELSTLTDVPVFIENDGNCCCWGELVFNRAEELLDFIYCLIEFREHHISSGNYSGLAIGLGIVIDGKVHRGHNYAAGEFRSVFAEEEHRGQFAITEENQSNVRDDPGLFTEFAVELSRNLAMIANTFALQDCFIGGDLEGRIDDLSGILRKELDANWSYTGGSACRIRTASIGDTAVAYGAAAMIIDRLFRIPGPGENKGDINEIRIF